MAKIDVTKAKRNYIDAQSTNGEVKVRGFLYQNTLDKNFYIVKYHSCQFYLDTYFVIEAAEVDGNNLNLFQMSYVSLSSVCILKILFNGHVIKNTSNVNVSESALEYHAEPEPSKQEKTKKGYMPDESIDFTKIKIRDTF